MGIDRLDVTSGAHQTPFDFHVNLMGSARDCEEAVQKLVEAFRDVLAQASEGPVPRVQCTMYTLERNAMAVIVTEVGLRRWRNTIATDGANESLYDLCFEDVNRVYQSFLRQWKAEGDLSHVATLDVFFPGGRAVHWSGTV